MLTKVIKIACAIWTLFAGLLWTLTQIASGFTIPGWIPATGLLSAGVWLVMVTFGV